MNNSNFIKLAGLMAGVVIVNIAVLSPGLLGVQIGGDHVLESALGITLLVVSFLILVYGSYTLLFKPPARAPLKDITTHEDYIEALHPFKNMKPLKSDVTLGLDQLERLSKKRDALSDVLSQRFDATELSYKRFHSVIDEVTKLFYLNIKGMLNKLHVFDPTEYASLEESHHSAKFSKKLIQEKTALYHEYLTAISGYVSANEEILLKLDKLLLEISQLGSTDYNDVEEMPCMKEIDALIQQTKFYNP